MTLVEAARHYLKSLTGDRYERNAAYAQWSRTYWRETGDHLWRAQAERVAREVLNANRE